MEENVNIEVFNNGNGWRFVLRVGSVGFLMTREEAFDLQRRLYKAVVETIGLPNREETQ